MGMRVQPNLPIRMTRRRYLDFLRAKRLPRVLQEMVLQQLQHFSPTKAQQSPRLSAWQHLLMWRQFLLP
jgi:hypothetical protein